MRIEPEMDEAAVKKRIKNSLKRLMDIQEGEDLNGIDTVSTSPNKILYA